MLCGMRTFVFCLPMPTLHQFVLLIKVGLLLTGGEDSKINVWTCPTSQGSDRNESMDIDDSPSRKRFVNGMDEDVRYTNI